MVPLALLMCQCNDDELVRLHQVDQAVGKVGHATRPHDRFAVPPRPHGARLRPRENSVNQQVDTDIEAIPQSRDAVLVPADVPRSSAFASGWQLTFNVNAVAQLCVRSRPLRH